MRSGAERVRPAAGPACPRVRPSVTWPHYPVIWPYLICSLTTSGHVTRFTRVLRSTRPSASARMEMQRHLTTIKMVTIAATPLLINFSTSQPGQGLNLDWLSILDERKTQRLLKPWGGMHVTSPAWSVGLAQRLKSADWNDIAAQCNWWQLIKSQWQGESPIRLFWHLYNFEHVGSRQNLNTRHVGLMKSNRSSAETAPQQRIL